MRSPLRAQLYERIQRRSRTTIKAAPDRTLSIYHIFGLQNAGIVGRIWNG
jgi:hypothetical protein